MAGFLEPKKLGPKTGVELRFELPELRTEFVDTTAMVFADQIRASSFYFPNPETSIEFSPTFYNAASDVPFSTLRFSDLSAAEVLTAFNQPLGLEELARVVHEPTTLEQLKETLKDVVRGSAPQVELEHIAQENTEVGRIAATILQRYGNDFERLRAYPTRLGFASDAALLAQQLYDEVLGLVLSGEINLQNSTDLGRIHILNEALYQMIRAIESVGQSEDNYDRWTISNDPRLGAEQDTILHHGFYRVTTGLRMLGYNARQNHLPGVIRELELGVVTDERSGTRLATPLVGALANELLAAQGQGVNLQFSVPRAVPLAEADQEAMKIAVTELVHNAIKYADSAKPERWIRVEWLADQQALVVMDNGIGIRDTNAVWDAGVREASEHASGTGLGLADVRARLAGIGWEISVTSTPGEGSTFRLAPTKAKLDIAKLTEADVTRMNDTEKLELSLALMQYRLNEAERVQGRVKELLAQEGDIWPQVQQLQQELQQVISHSHNLWRAAQSGSIYNKLFAAFNSSSAQELVGMRGTLDVARDSQAIDGTGRQWLQHIVEESLTDAVRITSELTFSTATINTELRNQIPRWLRARSPHQEEVLGNTLVIRYPLETEITDRPYPGDVLRMEEWPPDPNEPRLASMLSALGWELGVTSEDGGIVVRLSQKAKEE